MAPEEPVKELGNVLSRLLQFMQEVPMEEHILFAKIDLANGYWRMIVGKESWWNFAYILPSWPGSPLQLVIPSALQMSWNESLAYFCATTETICDIAQAWIDKYKPLPTHVMEPLTIPSQEPRHQMSPGP
jgi:hypothetical protein